LCSPFRTPVDIGGPPGAAAAASVLEIAGGGADAKWLKKKADTKAETN